MRRSKKALRRTIAAPGARGSGGVALPLLKIIARSVDYSRWYIDIVLNAKLADILSREAGQ
jgi:hypothetical protein